MFQHATLAGCITGDVWDTAKINGIKLVKVAEGNNIIIGSCKDKLKINDSQMECLVAHVKANYPEADLSAPPAKTAAPAAAAPKAPAASPFPAKKEEVKKVNTNPFGN